MQFLQNSKHYDIKTPSPAASNPEASIVLAHPKLAPDLSAFLDKMIQAFEWNAHECLHLEIGPEDHYDYSAFWASKSLRLVVSFGIPIHSIGLFIPAVNYHLFKVSPFEVYSCDLLQNIAAQKELKSKIWQDLKSFKTLTPI
ncbi:MAG: hypothetical protein KA109_11185 [Saprospiraceae bacterium]|jgi:hypothetical protein|nr:hypothetical protein [Saprospiraceae bacterium]MBK6477639.1 hypothetical protein [Saprospiraceae bacterium]MBK6816489.1 hypothetical protein [Saprospiraceae bacterium]MBK7436486.1 hypothetical protein [Saprospiraceae bacterium]MBK8281084.1 hypothetical protein [Saprospiraceae bacterium]